MSKVQSILRALRDFLSRLKPSIESKSKRLKNKRLAEQSHNYFANYPNANNGW